MNKGNIALFDELYGDCTYHAPAIGELKREAFKKFVVSTFAAFPDGRYTIEDQVAEGDKVATRWSFAGTHQGELKGMAPTGSKVSLTGTSTFAIRDGKIASEWADYDALGQWQQLGVIPPLEKAIVRGKPKIKAKAKPKTKPKGRPKTKSKPRARR